MDEGEEDDTREQGAEGRMLSHVFRHGPLRLEGRTACLGDEDWLQAFTDGTPDPAGVIVRWDASVGPLEVELLDGEGAPIPMSLPEDVDERQPGEIRLWRHHYHGVFFARARASGTVSVQYSVEVFAPVYVR